MGFYNPLQVPAAHGLHLWPPRTLMENGRARWSRYRATRYRATPSQVTFVLSEVPTGAAQFSQLASPPRLPIAVPNFPRHITFSAVLKVPFSLLVSFGFRAGFVRVSCRVSPKLHLTPNRAVLSCSLSSRVRESGQSSPLLAPQSPWSACGGGSACFVLLSSVLS